MYSTATNLDLEIKNSFFYGQSATYDIDDYWFNIPYYLDTRGGMFYIKGNKATAPVISNTNEFKRNALSIKGGAFYLEDAILQDTSSTF